MNNVISRPSAPLTKDVGQYRRYSNTDPVGNDSGSDNTGSGKTGWLDLLSQLISGSTDVLTSVFGRTEAAQLSAYQTMYRQEQRANTILWVIIGLMVALGVVLIVRKTK